MYYLLFIDEEPEEPRLAVLTKQHKNAIRALRKVIILLLFTSHANFHFTLINLQLTLVNLIILIIKRKENISKCKHYFKKKKKNFKFALII